MSYIPYNPNPLGHSALDCSVRMLSKVLGISWEEAYAELCAEGFYLCNMPSSNAVIISVLLNHGFREHSLMQRCKDCYTVEMFCKEFSEGTYALFVDNHTIACIDGNYYDQFRSGNLIPLFYFSKDNDERGDE